MIKKINVGFIAGFFVFLSSVSEVFAASECFAWDSDNSIVWSSSDEEQAESEQSFIHPVYLIMNEAYMALTSHERGFSDIKKYPEYQKELDRLLLERAQQVCKAKGFKGLAGIPELTKLSKSEEDEQKQTWAWIPRYNSLTGKYELNREGFLREKPWSYRAELLGRGRARLSPNLAMVALYNGYEVEERSSSFQRVFGRKVPHLGFTTIPCSYSTSQVEEFWRSMEARESIGFAERT